MTRYKRKQTIVDAVQWTGENVDEMPAGTLAALGSSSRQVSDGRTSTVVPPRHAGVRLANRAVVVVAPGDYVVVTDRGPVQVRRQGEFEAEYEPVHPGDGETGQTDGEFNPDDPVVPQDHETRIEGIRYAIGQIDPEHAGNWTSDGRPQVLALEGVLGFGITADERDEAWAAAQEAQE